jgi:hypothetical protein
MGLHGLLQVKLHLYLVLYCVTQIRGLRNAYKILWRHVFESDDLEDEREMRCLYEDGN